MVRFAIMARMIGPQKNHCRASRGTLALVAGASALAVSLVSQPAEAKLLEIYLDGYLGGMYGTEPKFDTASLVTKKPDNSQGADFFNDQSGGLVGARAGVEVFFTDVYLQFDQYVTGRGFSGSSLQAMIGWDILLESGKWRPTLGAYGGLVFGFPYTPHFPIDTNQIATVGVALEGQAGVDYKLNAVMSLQILGTLGYHYMFAGAEDVQLTVSGLRESTRTHGFHLMAKAGLRFHFGL